MRVLAPLLLLMTTACTSAPLLSTCARKTGPFMADTAGIVAAGGTVSYEVTSALSANWRITVTWTNPNTDLLLRATVLACGEHLGCEVGLTSTASSTQPMIRELRIFGTRGMRFRFDVLGDPAVEQSFTIMGAFDTNVCT